MRAALVSVDIAALGEDPSKFFEALDAADRRIAEPDRAETSPLDWPVIWSGRCTCGSTMTIRRDVGGQLRDDDHDRIAEWTDEHAECEGRR